VSSCKEKGFIVSHSQNYTILQDVNNTGPETLPVSVCNCFLYFTCKEKNLKDVCLTFDSVLYVLLVVFYPSFYVVLNRKCFWASVVYIFVKWSYIGLLYNQTIITV